MHPLFDCGDGMRRVSGPNSSAHYPKIKNGISITRPTARCPGELFARAQIRLNRYEAFGLDDAAVRSVKRRRRAEQDSRT